ncbi:MAG: rod shape-determining protein MreD [Lachnospiraceae bacterium]|nr:rod shape-determining protein MreD [Lachnospiraceae bacterium]
MKRVIGQSVLVMLIFILQNTVFAALSFNGVKPNLLLIVTVFFGFAVSTNNGMLTGFFCGLLCDIFFGSYIGVYSFLFMLLGGFGGVMARFFYQDDIVFPYVTVALSDGLFGLACYVFMFLLRGRFDFVTYVSRVILPEILYTLILSLLLIPLLHKFNLFFVKLELKEKESDVSGNT